MSSLDDETAASVAYIKSKIGPSYALPKAAIICGSGLSTLVDALVKPVTIPYADIPYFQMSTVPGHSSNLVYGLLQGSPVLAMVGRFHFYEGYTMKQVTYPIRVFKKMQIEIIVVTNAAGGLNPNLQVGDLMVISDHINMPGLCGQHPLMGRNEAEFGERFVPLSDAYDLHLRQQFFQTTKRLNLKRAVHEGVYCFVSGPTYETRAECRMIRNVFGADVVGMSSVPEVIVARHSGLRVLAISLVTNACVQEPVPSGQSTTAKSDAMTQGIANHAEVIDAGKSAAKDMQTVIGEVIAGL